MFGLGLLINEYSILIGLLGFFIYKWSVSTFNYFEKWNIPTEKPVPFFGSSLPIILSTKTVFEYINSSYKQFKDSRQEFH